MPALYSHLHHHLNHQLLYAVSCPGPSHYLQYKVPLSPRPHPSNHHNHWVSHDLHIHHHLFHQVPSAITLARWLSFPYRKQLSPPHWDLGQSVSSSGIFSSFSAWKNLYSLSRFNSRASEPQFPTA